MKVRFWGVRGSIPVPGAETARYGGNTTCIEVRTDAGDLIVLDGGTGIYPLSRALTPEMPLTVFILITHTHWDHIQGLPFFIPLFVPDNEIVMHGPGNSVTGKGIEDALDVQFQYSFFPVREAELKARIRYETLQPGRRVSLGGASVTPILLNHPVINLGYRIDCQGRSVFFTGDHEPPYNIYAPGDPDFEEFGALIRERERAFLEVVSGVDLLIADASYTPEEYESRKGWGHGSLDACIRLAEKAGAGRLVCTHHEPTRTDEALERMFAEAMARHGDGDLDICLAREGLEIEW